MKRKLIIVEGFDRIGKDTFLTNIDKNINDCEVYIQHNDPPFYRNKEEFRTWLLNFLHNQADELNSIQNNIVMARLFTSDYVYSSLFDRAQSTNYAYELLSANFDIYQIILLYKSYEDYLDRCTKCNCEVEYSLEEFNKINNYYLNSPFNSQFVTKVFYNPNSNFTSELEYLESVLGGNYE